jgi:hypothetical protein
VLSAKLGPSRRGKINATAQRTATPVHCIRSGHPRMNGCGWPRIAALAP